MCPRMDPGRASQRPLGCYADISCCLWSPDLIALGNWVPSWRPRQLGVGRGGFGLRAREPCRLHGSGREDISKSARGWSDLKLGISSPIQPLRENSRVVESNGPKEDCLGHRHVFWSPCRLSWRVASQLPQASPWDSSCRQDGGEVPGMLTVAAGLPAGIRTWRTPERAALAPPTFPRALCGSLLGAFRKGLPSSTGERKGWTVPLKRLPGVSHKHRRSASLTGGCPACPGKRCLGLDPCRR